MGARNVRGTSNVSESTTEEQDMGTHNCCMCRSYAPGLGPEGGKPNTQKQPTNRQSQEASQDVALLKEEAEQRTPKNVVYAVFNNGETNQPVYNPNSNIPARTPPKKRAMAPQTRQFAASAPNRPNPFTHVRKEDARTSAKRAKRLFANGASSLKTPPAHPEPSMSDLTSPLFKTKVTRNPNRAQAQNPQLDYSAPRVKRIKSNFKSLNLRIAWPSSSGSKTQKFVLREWYDFDLERKVTIFHNPFTTVGKFVDVRTKKGVAVKQIRNARKYLEEITNEILILRYLNEVDRKHKYFPHLYDVWLDEQTNTVYLALQYFRYDLDQVLSKMRKAKVRLDNDRIKYFIWKSFVAIDILHRAQILHRDIKPQNVLVKEDLTGIRMIDFGSACTCRAHDNPITQDRYTYGYIPLEISVGQGYKYKADVFSAGCMWWEMLREGKRLVEFRPNLKSRTSQLEDNMRQIVRKLGRPRDKYEWVENPHWRQLCHRLGGNQRDPLEKITDLGAYEPLAGMLKLNPSERWDMSRVLNHSFWKRYRKAEPPIPIPYPFHRPKTKSKSELWELLLATIDEFTMKNHRKRSSRHRLSSQGSQGKSLPASSIPRQVSEGALKNHHHRNSNSGGHARNISREMFMI